MNKSCIPLNKNEKGQIRRINANNNYVEHYKIDASVE